jgi:hypothetical protein
MLGLSVWSWRLRWNSSIFAIVSMSLTLPLLPCALLSGRWKLFVETPSRAGGGGRRQSGP